MPNTGPVIPEYFDNDPAAESLSVADRIFLGRMQPWGNPSYLAGKMGATADSEPWHHTMPPSIFPCPLCTGKVIAKAHPEVIGVMELICDNSCDAVALVERCRIAVPMAFEWRDDLLPAIPDELLTALQLRLREGTFSPGCGPAMSHIAKLRAGAIKIRDHVVEDANGSPIFLITGFEYQNEGEERHKQFCQFHATRDINGAVDIAIGLPPSPWPMVGLANLARLPDATVMVVEGEQARERASKLLPDYALVTSVCGSCNAHKTDWAPLQDRNVVIVPDNDEAGERYAKAVAAQAIAEVAASVRIVQLPKDLPTKWDLADELPLGVTLKDVRQWIEAAPETSWAAVREYYRAASRVQHTPPFQLPDGHLAKVRNVVEGLKDALEHIHSGCARPVWMRIIGGIFHAVGAELGLPIAKEWSAQRVEEHGKFRNSDWPQVFDAIVTSPPRAPMSLRSLIWEAIEQSQLRAEEKDRCNSDGWKPNEQLMAEANLADFEARHRAVLRGDGLEVAVQKQLPDGNYCVEMHSQKAAEAIYRSKKTVDYKGNTKKVLDFWLDNQRLPVLRAVFRPGAPIEADEYNLFQGLAVQPKAGSGSYRLLRELLDRIGADNQDDSDFIFKLIAWRLQNLDALVPSALILVGPEGSFKTTIADVIAELLAPYVLTISDPGKFVGRFNAHLFGKLFVQLEEVSLGKDETLDSRMKHFVNGKTLDLEEKGQPAFSIENRLFIAITSNKRDVIRISPSSRRYAAYWVKDAFNGDEEKRSAHWIALWQELESGGLQALMHDLLNADLTGFNPRLCPRTPFFHELAGISSDRTPHVAWWQDVLERRELPLLNGQVAAWTDPVAADELYKRYVDYCEANGPATRARTLSASAWAREMNKIVPGGLVKKRLPPSEQRKAVYFLPAYEECCAAFERAFKVTVERSDGPEAPSVPF